MTASAYEFKAFTIVHRQLNRDCFPFLDSSRWLLNSGLLNFDKTLRMSIFYD